MESGSGYNAYFINDTPSVNATVPSSNLGKNFLVVIPATVQLLLCGIALKVLYQVPSVRTASMLPVIHLVTSDFVRAIVGFLGIPVMGVQRTATPSTADTLLCVAFHFINNAQFAWSNWAIAIVAYSRADVIANVLTPTFTKRKFWGFAVASWLIVIITSLPPLVGWSPFGFQRRVNSYVCAIAADREGLLHALYMPLFYVVNFFVPSVLVVLCFSRVLRVAIRYVRAHNPSSSMQTNIVMLSAGDLAPSYFQQHREQTAKTQIKDILRSKAFRYMVTVVMTNLFLFAPFVGVKSYSSMCIGLGLRRGRCVPETVLTVVTVLHTLNYNINAFLYVFWIRTVQQSARTLFCCGRHQTAGQ